METKGREAYGKQNADGKTQYVSVGRRLSFEEFEKLYDEKIPEPYRSLYKENIIFANFDCEHGNSGGPVVNQHGEVVGTFVAIYNVNDPLTKRICAVLKSSNKTRLLNTWNLLE